MLASAESIVSRITDVAAAWLLTYLVHSTLILLATWAVTSRKRMSDATRDLFWKTALIGGIVTASLQTAITREPLGGQLRLAPRTASAAAPAMRLSVRDRLPDGKARIFILQPKGTRWTSGLLMLWLTTAGAGLLWLTIGHARTFRVLGGRTPLDATPIADRMQALLRSAGVRQHIELSCSAGIASPVALAGNEVCLPRRAIMELEPAEQDSMLAHEIAHLVRRDPHWLIAARVLETVLFVQPLNRLARHRLQEVAEYLCDDWAVARTSHPVPLAKCLAAVAEWVARTPGTGAPRLQPMSAMVEPGGSPLVRRVGRILDERTEARPRAARGAFSVGLCAVVALAAVAPRISVGNAMLTDRTISFVRTMADVDAVDAVDAVLLTRDPTAGRGVGRVSRFIADSVVARTRSLPPGATAQAVVGRVVARPIDSR